MSSQQEGDQPHPEMVPLPKRGRVFSGEAVVRLGDVLPSRELRLDALVRHTQQVSNDDTMDAGLDDDLAWVARSTAVTTIQSATVGERLRFQTFCGGIGSRWAERRLSVSGSEGAHYEVATLWVTVDPQTGRPRKVSQQFHDLYGVAAGERKVSPRLTIRGEMTDGADYQWPTRAVDFDPFGHVNNAVYWSTVEDAVAVVGRRPSTVVVEHHAGIQPGSDLSYRLSADGAQWLMWWVADGEVRAAARLSYQP